MVRQIIYKSFMCNNRRKADEQVRNIPDALPHSCTSLLVLIFELCNRELRYIHASINAPITVVDIYCAAWRSTVLQDIYIYIYIYIYSMCVYIERYRYLRDIEEVFH